jgi:uncharacterized protein (DUF1501 family)
MISRRHFLQSAGAWSALMATGRAGAATVPTDYKALVCIFLAGGNDSFNTVLATDTDSWAAYNSVRSDNQGTPIALLAPGVAPTSGANGSPQKLGGVLPLSPLVAVPNHTLALHPNLVKTAGLFNTTRNLAIVANVGPLIQPTLKEDYVANFSNRATATTPKLPPKLYSHNDQQNTWMALSPEGGTVGWGGQLIDPFWTSETPQGRYGAISIAGNAVWLSGNSARQYQTTTSGAIKMGTTGTGTTVFGSAGVANALQRIASNGLAGTGATGTARARHALMADLGTVSKQSIQLEGALTTALATLPASDARVSGTANGGSGLSYTNVSGASATNGLAAQLQAVARIIGVRSALGLATGRQVFFVQLGGFDTHDDQNIKHADLMAKLDHALAYFDAALTALGVQNQVTTFTASDFGRTFTSNGDGTDHGWGAHHFVMGGAVRGGKVYGSFPTLGVKNANNNSFDSSINQLPNGALLPTTSVDQMGGTLATWFGVTAPGAIFTNLHNFGTQNLGFI